MKTARGKFAAGAVFLLAIAAFLAPSTPSMPASAAPPAAGNPDATLDAEALPPPRSIFAGTAIGFVLEANGNEIPKTGEQMMRVLRKFGEFAQLPITFSAVDLRTRLDQPRIVVAQAPSFAAGPTQTTISAGSLTRPNLEGRLFLAANMEKKGDAYRVKTFEFISWNSRKQKFDFGFIECDDVEPQIRVVDGVKCFSCHKNRGPILGQGPWSNTPHNDMVRQAVASTLHVDLQALCLPDTIGQPHSLSAGFEGGIVKNLAPVHDGMSVLIPQGPAVDAAVRMGADIARDRNVYRELLRNGDGRRALVVLLGAIAAPGSLEQNSHKAAGGVDQVFSDNYGRFAGKWVTLHKNSSSTLSDFNPSGSMGSVQMVTSRVSSGWGGGSTLQSNLQVTWGGTTQQVTDYDSRRANDDHGLPSGHQPSNPKAFVRPTVPAPRMPSVAVNAIELARLIGLTEGDRAFLAVQLSIAVQQLGSTKITAAQVAREVFSGPQFMELFKAGEIPDREDFKDRFVNGLNEFLKSKKADELKIDRARYASGPNVAPIPGQQDLEPPFVATTTCVRCHDVRGAGKPAFSPIPMLAFDPYDPTSREQWVKVTPAKVRQPILARLLKRVGDDRDMPPEDSAEYESFRVKDSTALDGMKEWLAAELKKAKGQ